VVPTTDPIGALYRVVDDNRLGWLDDLMTTAGLIRRCRCTATARTGEACPECGADETDTGGGLTTMDNSQRGRTRMSVVVYCDVDLAAFADGYGVDQSTALDMAQADVREWAIEVTRRLSAEPTWSGIGAWSVRR